MIALARCLIKRPDILILSDALSNLDLREQSKIVGNVKAEMQGRSLILFESNETHRQQFEQVLRMADGRIRDPDSDTDDTEGTETAAHEGDLALGAGDQPRVAGVVQPELAQGAQAVGIAVEDIVRSHGREAIDVPASLW